MRYALNEMFARHGLDFNKPEVKAQFSRFRWYQPVDGRTEAEVRNGLNRYERANMETLARVRDQKRASEPWE